MKNGYTDVEILKVVSKEVMLKKIKEAHKESNAIENILKNHKPRYKDCWNWELIK